MTSFTIQQFIDIENTVRLASDAIRVLGTKEHKDNLKSAEYLMSVIRSHAQTYHSVPIEEAGAAIAPSLISALYR